ncbi:MAG: hypothetical protein KF749_14560 [Bacteroidetes bacterium]|nr:hypothetical protein [Bacteroidota bacterium]MCW5895725.1 hypothetical protein [Bacteroidota bacterium]
MAILKFVLFVVMAFLHLQAYARHIPATFTEVDDEILFDSPYSTAKAERKRAQGKHDPLLSFHAASALQTENDTTRRHVFGGDTTETAVAAINQGAVRQRIFDLEIGLGFPSGLNICLEVFPFSRLSLAGCIETALLITDVSFGVRYRVPLDEISLEDAYRIWRIGPLVGLRKRTGEFEGPSNFPWQLDIGASYEYASLPNEGAGFTLGTDLGARVALAGGGRPGLPLFFRITVGFAL